MLAPIGIAYITALVCSTIISVSILPVMATYLLPSALKKIKKVDGEKEAPDLGFSHDDTMVVKYIKRLTRG
jgi:Cu/Ag efflux pump CusA